MASTYFSYTPISGHGETTVSAKVLETNSGRTSKDATITFDDGTGPWYLKVSQYYKPYYQMPVTVFPVSGGTLDFVVNSKYDYFFHQIPDWTELKKKRGNLPVSADTKIAGREGVVYTLTASANTSSMPRTAVRSFYLGYYDLKGSAQTASYFMLMQRASGVTAWEEIPVNVDFHASTNRAFAVTLALESLDDEPDSTTINFQGGTSSWAGTLDALVSTVSAETPLKMTVTVDKDRFDVFNYENNIALDYGTDSLYETGPIGTGYTFETIFQTGEDIDIGIDVQDI